MADALAGWGTRITFKLAQKVIADFEAVEKPITDVRFNGVLEPIPPRKLMVKPEGERNWKWYTMWSRRLIPNGETVIDDRGLSYRIMSNSPWRHGGFNEYEMVQEAQ